MNLPPVVSADEWRVAREALLVKEKEATRARDALAAERRRLPRVHIDKGYVFDGPEGKAALLDLFEGRGQLPRALTAEKTRVPALQRTAHDLRDGTAVTSPTKGDSDGDDRTRGVREGDGNLQRP